MKIKGSPNLLMKVPMGVATVVPDRFIMPLSVCPISPRAPITPVHPLSPLHLQVSVQNQHELQSSFATVHVLLTDVEKSAHVLSNAV